jgi:hypothetical protein
LRSSVININLDITHAFYAVENFDEFIETKKVSFELKKNNKKIRVEREKFIAILRKISTNFE